MRASKFLGKAPRAAMVLLLLSVPARADDAELLLSYSCDETAGNVLKDAGPTAATGTLNINQNGQINGAEISVRAADTWTPILTREGTQHKNITTGSDAILAGGERPIVLDRDKDYAIDIVNGLIKALPGGRMEIGQPSTIDFQYKNDGPQRIERKTGLALKLDGVDDFVTLGHLKAANRLDAVTLSLWVYLDKEPDKEKAADTIILSKNGVEKNGARYGLGLSKGVLHFFHPSLKGQDGKAAPATQDKAALPRETWLHLAATFDGAIAILFVNGHEVARQAGLTGSLEANGEFTIGGIRDPEFLKGVVDEIKIYKRALTAVEIEQNAT